MDERIDDDALFTYRARAGGLGRQGQVAGKLARVGLRLERSKASFSASGDAKIIK